MKGFAFKTSLLGLSLLSCLGETQLQAATGAESRWIGLMQQQDIRGVVRNEQGQGMAGVTVLVAGTTVGTSTASDGSYRIALPKGKSQLLFSMVGYSSQTLTVAGTTLNVNMLPAGNVLEELVVVGYGSTTKKDLTGAVNTVGSKDFNGGLVGSPEQLINGKTAGVQVMSNSGSPSSGSTIRIRGGASLSASNDPLIVLDGVPLETGGISGNSGNFLSLINPNDIESMTVLKDASSTAIYGSRASNGVLLITTKKGKGDALRLSFSSIVSMQQAQGVADMMSRNEFAELINSKGTAAQKALLGNSSTDWLSEVFQQAMGTDNNLSLQGKMGKVLPFRASVGYYNQQGTLRTDKTERMTGALVVNPTFFNKHLTVNLNVKAARNNNSFANTDAIWSAVAFNPTQPIYSGVDAYGGYYESLDNAG
ncbi:TonB-dependent receptor plug domain-containing protein, partial [Chitinophaga sp.]|uniref:TonB-dependent receptor plug domain-containing protein n=1 Tax=Chitinophaga sp. TaxID=1869181 RepID=UPI002CB494B1